MRGINILQKIILACVVLISSTGWPSTTRFGVIVGNNLGRDPAKRLRYAEQDAQKVYQVLLENGGFSADNLRLLKGRSSSEVQKTLHRLEQRLLQAVRRGKKTLFMFYFSGHADGDVLEMGRSALAFEDLRSILRLSRATVRLAFIDSCQSGGLVSTKGARVGPTFKIKAHDELDSAGYAVITSSADNELSQESEEVRGSYFTHYLVSALRGAADSVKDGRITLNEAYRYAYARTVMRTTKSLAGSQHPTYDFKLAGRGDVVLTFTDAKGTHLRFVLPKNGRIIVLDRSRDTMVAEANTEAKKPLVLMVHPGEYTVFYLTEGRVQMAKVKVPSRQGVDLGPSGFIDQPLTKSITKGGFFRLQKTWRHDLSASMILRRFPFAGVPLAYGGGLSYSLTHLSGWSPTLSVAVLTAPDEGASSGYLDFGVTLGFGREFDFTWLRLRPEIDVGYEHLMQKAVDETRRHTSGLATHAKVGVVIPMGVLYALLSIRSGVRFFKLRYEGWSTFFDVGGELGLGLSF